MDIDTKLSEAINSQIGHEFQASHIYYNMAAYFESLGLKKLAARFFEQGDEEHAHGMKFLHYLIERGAKVAIPAFAKPHSDFASVQEAFKLAYNWEKGVTLRIINMMNTAVELKDYATQAFLQWFINEQVEEEASMEGFMKLAESVGDKNLFMFEAYFSHA